jgi:hypothetical protein
MVQHMQHAPAKTEGRHDWIAQGHPDHPNSQADQDDANILNARVGQEPLDIILAEGVNHTQNTGYHSGNQNNSRQSAGVCRFKMLYIFKIP